MLIRSHRATCRLAGILLVWAGASIILGQGPPPSPVVVAPVVQRELPASLRLVGTVRPDRVAVVAAEVSGVISVYDRNEGDALKAGEVICQIDDAVARLKLEEAEATLDGLKASLEELETGERPEELERLAALLAEAEAERAKTDFERKRLTDLFGRGQSSDKERFDAEMDYQMAAGRWAQAKAQHEMAVHGARAEVVVRARLAVSAQQAVVRRLQRDLEKTRVRAPFDCAVVRQRTEVGQWIQEGGAAADVVALDVVNVRVDVPERAIVFARVGAEATIELEALGRTLTTPITRVIPMADEASRTFPVEMALANKEHELLPGMFVWVHVPAGPTGSRLMVSKDALVSRGQDRQIFVVRPGPGGASMAMPTPVTTGLEADGLVEVQAAGVQPGDMVVVRANERLYGPTPVIPQPAGAANGTTTQPAGGQPAEARTE